MPPINDATAEFQEFHNNIGYARQLLDGGRRLQQLQVSAFDVNDIYRAAWVQAVAALDHWVYRELVHRAVMLIQHPSTPRPERFKKLDIPVDLFEQVHHHGKPLDEAFRAHIEATFQFRTFQRPDAIETAFTHVRNGKLWPKVANALTAQRTDGKTIAAADITGKLSGIAERRNQIAHAYDRDPTTPSGRAPISAAETLVTINWIEAIAAAILTVLDGTHIGKHAP